MESIITKKLKTTVKFGSNGKGRISVGGCYGALLLQELINTELGIGTAITDEKDISELPSVLLLFNDISSIDVVISKLEHVKQIMLHNTYILAC